MMAVPIQQLPGPMREEAEGGGMGIDGRRGYRLSPLKLLERRRARERSRRLETQYANGRPRSSWILCGSAEGCTQSSCVGADEAPAWMLVEREQGVKGWRVEANSRTSEFAAAMATRIWRSSWWRMEDVLQQVHSIASFVASPPVRRAYVEFKLALEAERMYILCMAGLAQVLHSRVLPRFHGFLARLGTCSQPGEAARMVHAFLEPPGRYESREAWTMEDYAMRFLLKMELWRRLDARQTAMRRWDFGPPRVVAELLAATALHMHRMDEDEGCFKLQPCSGDAEYDDAWQTWMDAYPISSLKDSHGGYDVRRAEGVEFAPRPVGDTGWPVASAVGYLGGVGRAEGSGRTPM